MTEKVAKPLVDLTEDEQWKIINDTKILDKFESTKEKEPHLLVAFLLSIPLIFCHAMFDYIAHLQFGYEQEFTWDRIKEVEPPAYIAIFIFALVTNYFKNNRLAQFIYTAVSIAVGCLVIYYCIDDGTFGAMLHTPGLVTLGILLVIQQDVQYAVVSLMACGLYYNRVFLMAFVPSGSLPSMHTEL